MDFLVKELRLVKFPHTYGFFEVGKFEQPYNAIEFAKLLMKRHKKNFNSPYKVRVIHTGFPDGTFEQGEYIYESEHNFDNIEVV